MTRQRVLPQTVYLTALAQKSIVQAAESALPRETGGILLGYRLPSAVVVTKAHEVVDRDATPTSYTSDGSLIQAALDELSPGEPPKTGFVGPWHAHPADSPHSSIDMQALKRITRQYSEPIVSVVAVRTVDGYRLDAHVARKVRATRVRHLKAKIIEGFPRQLIEG